MEQKMPPLSSAVLSARSHSRWLLCDAYRSSSRDYSGSLLSPPSLRALCSRLAELDVACSGVDVG